MELNKKEIMVLKTLLKVEIEELAKDSSELKITNSPFLYKVEEESDLDFLKNKELYNHFLKELLEKLKNE